MTGRTPTLPVSTAKPSQILPSNPMYFAKEVLLPVSLSQYQHLPSFTPPQKGAGMMLEGADKATTDKLAGILAAKHII